MFNIYTNKKQGDNIVDAAVHKLDSKQGLSICARESGSVPTIQTRS